MYAAHVIPDYSPRVWTLLGLAAIGGAFAVYGFGCAVLDKALGFIPPS